jgi:uncharacterized membrane protein YccC
MVRKQLYLEPRQQSKLRKLAARWGCTEAQVIRKALDRLPDPDDASDLQRAIVARLAEAGLLVPPPDDDAPMGEELEHLEREYEEWLDSLPGPLGLGEAVLEDRR